MSKQKIPIHLKRAIWIAYDCKSFYEGIPIEFLEMEIDHIIPERVLLSPKEPDELNKWKKKYHLDDAFNIQGIENLCPSTRRFNLMKSDKGLDDKVAAYRGHIERALVRAQELKPKIIELSNKFKDNQKISISELDFCLLIKVRQTASHTLFNSRFLELEHIFEEYKEVELLVFLDVLKKHFNYFFAPIEENF